MIRLVINSIPTAPGGGLTNLLGLLEGWKSNQADLDIKILASRTPTLEALHKNGYDAQVIRVPQMNLVKRAWWERFSLPALLRRLKPDVLLSNNYTAPFAPCPQVVHHQTLDNFFSHGFLPYWRRGKQFVAQTLAARQTLRRAHANVFISGYLRQCAEELVPDSHDRNEVVYYGLSEYYSKLARTRQEVRRDPYQLCALQFPSGYKDNESLLVALSQVVQARPQQPWRLDIAGWGDWSPWKERAAQLGIGDRVQFLGMRTGPQVAEMLRGAGVLVYPSVFEGFGLPVIEAMASGCPVIAVNGTAIPEVAAGAAVLVPPRSPADIASALLHLADDAELRADFSARGLARARQFSWTAAARSFCRVFERVLQVPIHEAADTSTTVPVEAAIAA